MKLHEDPETLGFSPYFSNSAVLRASLSMASVARAIHCELSSQKPALTRREPAVPAQFQVPVPKAKPADADGAKILLQPRLCNLRSYGSDQTGVIRTRREGADVGGNVSPFFATLSEYIESSKKSHDFEIISGRLAMVSFCCCFWM